eukprot:TRINITY_DN3812_c0_g1_i1.p1 TRINITY_DN3812_c0_g1~~TRINITY_DN3812_c0_g1_i1.p1  ORF type:complete len:207 (-),score=57.52 TRINITY_DN3812_c0_g1_i1:171-791(-)
MSHRNPFNSVDISASFQTVLALLGTEKVRRLPVYENERLVYIYSQMSMIKYIAQHRSYFPFLEGKTVGDLHAIMAPRPILTLPLSDVTQMALEKLNQAHISAMPVVDGNGKLVANFSLSNLLSLSDKAPAEISHFLSLPIHSFVTEGVELDRACRTCEENAKLFDVVDLLAATGFHRVWVVDSAYKPTASLSISDLLFFVASKISS